MTSDFLRDYGVNAGYVQALFEQWKSDAGDLDASWRELFERQYPEDALAIQKARAQAQAQTAERDAEPGRDGVTLEPLVGVAKRIVANMTASLSVPTATSVRTVPAKVLTENRSILNEHMQLRALGKASYTHLIAFALARALGESPRMIAAFEEREGRPYRRLPVNVNLGLAIDVPGPDPTQGRMLVVPKIAAVETLDFRAFLEAYEELVARGRTGKLGAEDFHGTNVTLTNPGGFGTQMSVPRLMEGQGLIIATGSIAIPPELAGASTASLARVALGPVMTITSTYDHRVIQGAESGLMLRRIDELLQGADGFYEQIFRSMRVPWKPHQAGRDLHTLDVHEQEKQQLQISKLITAYRNRGCRVADLDPLEYKVDPLASLDPSSYGFTVWDLDRSFLCDGMTGRDEMTLREILAVLRRSYCRRWTIEYMHVVERKRKHWIRERIESPEHNLEFDQAHRLEILEGLHRAENFERFLHAKYVGNKRFSLEGADTLIPALAELIDRAANNGVERVVIGMAHRGRLNVLANILGKSYAQIFREFEAVLLPLSTDGSGDVKYHLGQRGTYRSRGGSEVEVLLSANPSHLEAVDPVVCGMTRAYQDASGDTDRKKTLAVLIHGDAAFSGQGVVAETLNMSRLPAYRNGGTVHLVVNNQIGFTASPRDLRSTYYCTDVAKSIQAPILHANGDYPESVLRSVCFAFDYQREFGQDVVIDMVCYRRWGHNEGDEPAYTQPVLYSKIKNHPTVCEHYTQLLIRRGAFDEEEVSSMERRFVAELTKMLERSREETPIEVPLVESMDLDDDDPADYVLAPSPETGVPIEELVSIIDHGNRIPEGHVTHPNLMRQLRRREGMVRGERGVDWGCAEALAFGTLLRNGVPIRLAGQDSGRGTFSHRHAVIRDQVTEKDYVPLRELAEGVDFDAWDSLLSEEAALAYEYGYSVARKEALTLWEGQFGDFVNGAQIAIDQFIVAGEAKWKQTSGVTLLLPHGYDGQGPEHSSARPERFLGLCTGGNLTVANCSTSAQYFHLLRRQGLTELKRPLVILTPKSLLRDKRAASDVSELATGRFPEVLNDPKLNDAKHLILCSGKVYYDLEAYRTEHARDDVAIVRLEQLYPLPADELREIVSGFGQPVWCQEEPRNMGAWPSLLMRTSDLGFTMRYAGRPDSASPATGSYRRHQIEQERLVQRAFGDA